MGLFRKDPEAQYKPNENLEHFFKAYVVKGNRNIITRDVQASRRFKIEGGMYYIKPDCIRRKVIDGVLTSVSYYRENNPNPYNFKTENKGITPDELDHVFAEDFYEIIIELNPDSKIFYFLLMAVVNTGLCISFLCGVILRVFIFK